MCEFKFFCDDEVIHIESFESMEDAEADIPIVADEYEVSAEDVTVEERWEDLRAAVAEFLNLDPVELTFMSFINEDRFDTSEEGWQSDLASNDIWDEILDICNSNLSWKDLGDDESDDSVIKDILDQGSKLMIKLRQQEDEMEEEDDEDEGEEYYEEVVEETYVDEVFVDSYYPLSYWDCYYDPFYVSPVYYDPYWF